MAQRLVLSTAGIKSPLDLDEIGCEPPAGDAPAPSPPPRRLPQHKRGVLETVASPTPEPNHERFYGTGRPLQTSIALDTDRSELLTELARAAGVSANALAVAALQVGLPAGGEEARRAIVEERVRRAGERTPRIECNLRLPEHLRARVDELVTAGRGRLPRATRADLVNAALYEGLPTEAQSAAELVAEHARRLERAVAA